MHNGQGTAEFYDSAYEKAEFVEWDALKLSIIKDVLGRVFLPDDARILDFGCGVGSLTSLLRDQFPDAEVVGTDLSRVALRLAKKQHPAIEFVQQHEVQGNFDLIFSHHVLEHVTDIHGMLDWLCDRMKPGGAFVLFWPCSNRGSYERNLAQFRQKPPLLEGNFVFWYDDPGHLRRWDSDRTLEEFARCGLSATYIAYRNQYWSALQWFAKFNPVFVMKWCNPFKARRGKRLRAVWTMFVLLTLTLLTLPIRAVRKIFSGGRWGPKKLVGLILLPVFLLLSPIGLFVEKWLAYMARWEWISGNQNNAGSEFIAIFTR